MNTSRPRYSEPNGTYPLRGNESRSCNNGFWDRPAEERAARMDAAAERGGVSDFFDLPADERARAYDAE